MQHFPLHFPLIPTTFYPRLGDTSLPPELPELFLGGEFIQVGVLRCPFAGTSPVPAARPWARPLLGFYLAGSEIFLSNALGKQMSEAEIQIVFANGNGAAKECTDRYSLGGKFLPFM